MSAVYEAVKISEHASWVGAVDWGIRDFHGYNTHRGSTYNAYLVLGEKITLVDTVKASFRGELMSRIASLIDPKRIDYIVTNHVEMDHTGCLDEVIREVRPEKVFASAMGTKILNEHFSLSLPVTPVKEGEKLSLGNLEVAFLETRMVHWPDSMFSYLVEDEVLFSQDGFGMHLATTERFADGIPEDILESEGGRYFANILLPYSPLIIKLLDKVSTLGISPQTIAPDHGPIWREDLSWILERYGRWAAQRPTRKAVVVYDTMWRSTEAMAHAAVEGLKAGGSKAVLMPLHSCHRSDVAAELLDAGGLLVGSPTLNNNLFPTVADVLTYLKGLKPANLTGGAFGSYGWSGEAVGQVRKALEAMGVEMLGESPRIKYQPDAEAIAQCHALGLSLAERLAAAHGEGHQA